MKTNVPKSVQQRRTIAALRAHLTRLRRERDTLRTTVKDFKAVSDLLQSYALTVKPEQPEAQ